jgi:chromosome partitioning protein
MQIITICNHKSKSGKTVTALNLAFGFNELNKKVLLIDLDPQASLTKMMGGLDSNETFMTGNNEEAVCCSIWGALKGKYGLSSSFFSFDHNVGLVASTLDLASLELELQHQVGGELCLKSLLAPLYKECSYDVVIIDSPSNFGGLLINALSCCDSVIVPISMEDPSIMRLGTLVDLIGNVREKYNSKLNFGGFLMTRVKETQNKLKVVDVRKKLEETYDLRVLDTVVRYDPHFARIEPGNSIKYSHRSNGLGEGDYLQLCHELLKKTGNSEGFITISNLKRIARKISLTEESRNKVDLDERFLKLFDNTQLEEWRILIFLKKFLTDKTVEKLQNIVHKNNRSNRWVFIDRSPRFHSNNKCKGLLSDYSNVVIPNDIPDDKIENYRLWYIENRNGSNFSTNHVEKWGCDPGSSISRSNSGVRDFSLILKEIDDLYSSIISMCDTDYGFRIVFDNFGKDVESGDDTIFNKMHYSKLVRPTDEFGNVDLSYNVFLSHLSFIAGIKRQIADLYESKFIYEGGTTLETSMLIEMGFVKCALCY